MNKRLTPVKIRFYKTHPDAQLPKRNHDSEYFGGNGDSGYDLFCVEDTIIPQRGSKVVPVGIKVAFIEPGYWFKIESRSGLSFKHNLLSHPGIIDNQYRGDCGILIYNHSDKEYAFKKGDKVAQFVVYELIDAEVNWSTTSTVDETKRGEKGFGSSG